MKKILLALATTLSFPNKRKIISLFFLIIFIFFMGAHFKKQEIWPFGQGYYASLKNIKNYGFNYKEILAEEAKKAEAKKAEEAKKAKANRKAAWGDKKTSLHNLNIDKLDFRFDHIAIIDETEDSLSLIGISGNGPRDGVTKTKLQVHKLVFRIADKSIQSNDLIFEDDNNYRATDVLVDSNKNIFISYASLDEKDFLNLKIIQLINTSDNNYESKLIFETNGYAPPFGVHQTGGKMAEIDKNNILVGVGDFQKGNLLDDDNYQLGKTLIVDKHSKNTSKIFTKGHRNIQGLAYSSTFKTFIATEHGPQGGDEINMLYQSKNYGWPHETYGIPYGQNPQGELYSNFGGANYGTHNKFTKPEFAFVPSIGIKAIEEITKDKYEFPLWKNNFLVCSAEALYRVLIVKEDNRPKVQLTEKITNRGCRDLVLTKKGMIITNDIEVISRNKGPMG